MLLRRIPKVSGIDSISVKFPLSRAFTVYSNQPSRTEEKYGQKKFTYDYSIHQYPSEVKVFL